MTAPIQNRQGQRVTGRLLEKKSIREALVEMLNCFYSPKITLKTRNADGTNTDLSPAEIKMGPLGWTAEIDLTNLGPYGAKSQTIIPATFYNIANGADPSATWKTVQFRDFVFGGRSKYVAISAYNNIPPSESLGTSGNGELKMIIINDFAGNSGDFFAQPSALATSGTLGNTADTVIFDPTINDGADGTFGQIILNDTVSTAGNLYAAFWLEIIDDGSFYYARLMARMFDETGAGGRSTSPFPALAETIIPVAIIQANPAITPAITQIQSGNLVNRCDPGSLHVRGDWTGDALSGQRFFPGDLVTNGNGTLGASVKKTYLRKTFGQTSTPPADGADWTALIN